MPAIDRADELFWLGYCKSIKEQLGTKFGDSSAIFYCTRTQRGPPAGDSIDPAYTNTGLYNIGDNLLAADNLFYVPSAQNSYINFLLTYLGYVDLGGNPGDAQLLQVKLTAEDLSAAQIKQSAELKLAIANYAEMKSAGIVGTQEFSQWYPTNALAFLAAKNQFDAAAAANQIALQVAYGAQAGKFTRDRNAILNATTSIEYVPGRNMPCTALTAANAREILNASNKGTPIPPPGAIFYEPAYLCPEYGSTVKTWQNLANSTTDPKSFIININSGKDVKDTDFGQTKISGDVSFTYAPWLSFSANGSSDHTDDSLKTEHEAEEIEITVFYDDMRAVTINPGSWNIGDPRGSYPNLRPGAPDSVKVLVRPAQMVLVSKLGYKVKLGVKLAEEFDKKVTDVKAGGGHVTIFGIPISIGGNVNKSTETTTHVGKWDKATQEFTVKATTDGGFASVIAIIGEKIKTN